MKVDDIKNICVVGAGNMGHQISLLCALSGYDTVCQDISSDQLKKAQSFVESYLPGRVEKGKISQEKADDAKQRLTFTANFEEAARDADFVIEAALENVTVKREIFRDLDKICPPHAILATNSSYIVSSKIADATNRPEKVCNMHFFNPALVMKCVEVVKGPHTSEETADVTVELTKRFGKVPALLKKEIYGFLVNRVYSKIVEEALFLLDMGVASVEDIDNAITGALGHPMGPFRLMDLTGIDLRYKVMQERFESTMDPAHKPSPSVVEKYVKGEWGRKVGKGFYEYQEGFGKK